MVIKKERKKKKEKEAQMIKEKQNTTKNHKKYVSCILKGLWYRHTNNQLTLKWQPRK